MRIAIVHLRHGGKAGAEWYLTKVAGYLAGRGHEVTIVCRSHEAPSHPAIRFHVLHDLALGSAWRMWAFARSAARYLRDNPFDVVFGVGRSYTHDVIFLSGGCEQSYLEHAHAHTLTRLEKLFHKGALKHRLALEIERRALAPGACRRVITNSEMVKRDVLRLHGVDERAIEVIYHGVDLERFHPRNRRGCGARLRAELGLDDSHLVVLFLGSGYGRKGLDLVMEAFAGLLRAWPSARLVVVGYDTSQAGFEADARRLGIAPATRFLGRRRDAEACYGCADLYAFPTRYDANANTTLEALASGLPVITSDLNGGGELIRQHVQGSLVSPQRGPLPVLEELAYWADPANRARGSLEARALAERHGLEVELEATERVLLDARRQRAAEAGPGPRLAERPASAE